jgi:general secretion pathway protein K
LVVTIATLLATEIWFNNTLDISRQANNRAAYQANHYAKGMVLWAKDVLRQDYEDNPVFDNHSDPWNQRIAGIELEDAILSGKLIDLDSKFNLNNLVIDGISDDLENQAYFKRLLGNLELDLSLADNIIDWLDDDQEPQPNGGAEDSFYLSKRPSYRTAGQYFKHISELKLVEGITDAIYQRLTAYVTVLPILGNVPTKMNINTVSTVLLKSLGEGIESTDAIALYDKGNASNQDLTEFFRQTAITPYNLDNLATRKLIETKSQWFNASITIKMDQTVFQKFALIYRGTTSLSDVREWSETSY